MRFELLLCVVAVFSMGLVGCSQPEPVISSYEPVDCPCEQDGVRPEKVAQVGEVKLVKKIDSPAPKNEDITRKKARFESKAEASKGKSAPTRAECEKLLSVLDKKTEKPEIAKPGATSTRSKSKSEVTAKSSQMPSGTSLLNLNTATLTQLMDLPGVGPALAGRIVAYRQKRQFTKTAHLMRVKGIGKAKYAKIMPLVAAGR